MLPNKEKSRVNNGWHPNQIYKLGPYRIDINERVLDRDGERLHLKPKTFDLLVFLIERSNKVASKDEIFETVWHGAFVEEANLAVHVSNLRKIFSSDDEPKVVIETVPKVGYRLIVENRDNHSVGNGQTSRIEPELGTPVTEAADESNASKPGGYLARVGFGSKRLHVILIVLVASNLIFLATLLVLSRRGGNAMGEGSNATNRKSAFTWDRLECPRDAANTNLEVGGCEDAVRSFSLNSNPIGNWAFGYTSKDDLSQFILFEKANHNNHFGSPEVPADFWTRPNEWHPLILKNTSNVVVVIQGAVVVSPSMFEMHPGPNGERSVVRWTAPADGHYRVEGQFRGINGSGYTSTDAMVIENGSAIRFSTNVEGYNYEKPFDLTFKLHAGDTVDFSVGYGSDGKYEGDSTGFSAIVRTLSLETSLPDRK